MSRILQNSLFICLFCPAVLFGCSDDASSETQGIEHSKSTDMQPSGDPWESVNAQSNLPGPPPEGQRPPGPPPTGQRPPGPPPDGQHPMGPPPGGFPPGFDDNHPVVQGTAVYTLTNHEVVNGSVYSSLKADENVFLAKGKVNATLNQVTVNKTAGDASSNDASSFYGLNAAVLAKDQAVLTINGGQIHAHALGATGIFAYGKATVYANNTQIDITGGNAGGVEVAGGATLYAKQLTVHSADKAAIRSDRGGGKLVVEGGRYTTAGHLGAPAIYSTADITVSHATLQSHDSEAVVIEGFNSVTVKDSDVTGSMDGSATSADADRPRNVMLYQSMSGDAQHGTSHFTMQGGRLTSENGVMFYVTNTDSVISLDNVSMTLAPSGDLLRVAGNDGKRGWGRTGKNGGQCKLEASHQRLTGNIVVDNISTLDFDLSKGSRFNGAINTDGTQALALVVTVDNSSEWTLSADSTINEFHGQLHNVHLNGHHLVINGKMIRESDTLSQ